MKITRLAFLSFAFLILIGCSKQSEIPAKPGGPYVYALLYSVTSQQQNVDKLLWVKEPGPEISAWVKKIAAFNKEVTTQLDGWGKDGTVTNLKDLGLPEAEVIARDRAKSRTTGELLFSKDIDLRVSLVVAQLKALGYCSDLSYAITQESKDESVVAIAKDWQQQFADLNTEGMNILEYRMGSEMPAPESGTPDKDPKPAPMSPTHKQ